MPFTATIMSLSALWSINVRSGLFDILPGSVFRSEASTVPPVSDDEEIISSIVPYSIVSVLELNQND